jgi:hypothetical protein
MPLAVAVLPSVAVVLPPVAIVVPHVAVLPHHLPPPLPMICLIDVCIATESATISSSSVFVLSQPSFLLVVDVGVVDVFVVIVNVVVGRRRTVAVVVVPPDTVIVPRCCVTHRLVLQSNAASCRSAHCRRCAAHRWCCAALLCRLSPSSCHIVVLPPVAVVVPHVVLLHI